MPKRVYKIKRYRHIYRQRRFQPVKVIAIVLVCLAAVFVGVSLYQPVRDFVTGKLTLEKPPEPEPSSVPEPVPEPPVAEPEPAPISVGVRAVGVPLAEVQAGTAVQFVQENGPEGTNALLVDLKTASGEVPYNSAVEMALEAQARSGITAPYNLADLCAQAHEAGLEVVGRLHAFRDPVAPYVRRNAAVKYMNSDWSWLDAAEENGGKAWLNPYSDLARGYISDLAAEAAEAGVDVILLCSVQFPEANSLETTNYGETAAAIPQAQALSGFYTEVGDRIGETGAWVLCCVDAPDALEGNSPQYGNASPFGLFGPSTAVRTPPSLFGASVEHENYTLENPAQKPYETVQMVLRWLRSYSGTTELLPLLQGYTSGNLNTNIDKTYTSEDVQAQLLAAQEAGCESWIILFEE